ncbi:hypothetical protein [Sutcliffiella rhizosphaerae]|uniref:Uncharacterized protein n=1 Tax=Sutcliffiella rhizosphaerae TaxID=2880967 RepID=A0ABM8YRA7_9BACI|nr:hypothetical protein [Sutcliffiella rhizosphaerae]CAG9622486.1 hypothetical protein BACCIP111883_03277 [Sutcliffiella rhizosphaerae]
MITSYFLKPQYQIGMAVERMDCFIPSTNIQEAQKLLNLHQPIFPGTFRMKVGDIIFPNKIIIDSIDSFWFGVLTALEALQEHDESSIPLVYQPLEIKLIKESNQLIIRVVHGKMTMEQQTFPLNVLDSLLTCAESFFQHCEQIGLTVIKNEYADICTRMKVLKR